MHLACDQQAVGVATAIMKQPLRFETNTMTLKFIICSDPCSDTSSKSVGSALCVCFLSNVIEHEMNVGIFQNDP